MSFIAPLALALGALAGPIILLYMLRLRRREVQVSSTMLWQQLLRDREANAPWQRLRRNLLLLLQLLILAALVLALARPYIEIPSVTAGRTALLIDASASMNATDVQPTRFDAARQRALEIVNALNEQDALAVVRVSETPEMVQGYTNDRELLRAAINNMKPGGAAADWDVAFRLAVAGARDAERFNVVLISDGGLPPGVGDYGEVRFVPIGNADANVAIAALSTGIDPVTGPQIYARLTNYGSQPAEVIFSITLDGALHSASPYTIQAKGYSDVVVTNLPEDFRRVQANLTRPTGSQQRDYLPTDDTAWAVFNPASAGRAVVLSRGNRFIEQGLGSLPDWQTFRGDPARGLPGERYDLYVFDGWLPAELPDANMLIVNPPTDAPTELFTVGPPINATRVTRIRPDDPRTRYLDFSDVNVLEMKQLTGAAWAVPLIEADGGPLVLAGEYKGRRVAAISFDLFNSDLPLKIAWPILLANLTEWYKSPRAVRVEGSLAPGQTLTIQPAADATTVRVSRPDGAITTLNVDQPLLIYADTPMSGIYTVDVYKDAELVQQEHFAVNLFDANESDIATRTPTMGGSSVIAAAQQEIGQQEFWPWIALAALVILIAEWFVYHRRLQAPRLRMGSERPFARSGRKF